MWGLKWFICVLVVIPTTRAVIASSSGLLAETALSFPQSTGNEKIGETPTITLGTLYRKSRQSRCVRCYYDDRRGDDYERRRYSGGGYSGRTYDNWGTGWYYPTDTYDRYDTSRYAGDKTYGTGNYYDRHDDRYSVRTYDRYDRDNRYAYDRSPSENRGYGYDNRDKYQDKYYKEYYRGGDRYSDRGRDRYGYDGRYYSRYDYRNYRPWDETYSGQSGFDNSGRGYYFASNSPGDLYESSYRPQYRPVGPSTPGPTYLPRDVHETSRGQTNLRGYPDTRHGPPSSPPSSSLSGSDYNNRVRDDAHRNGGGSGGGGAGGSTSSNTASSDKSDNKNGYPGSSWGYVNDRENDAGYKGGTVDKDNQSPSYGSGTRGQSLGGSYLLDRESNTPPPTTTGTQDNPSDSENKDLSTPKLSSATTSIGNDGFESQRPS